MSTPSHRPPISIFQKPIWMLLLVAGALPMAAGALQPATAEALAPVRWTALGPNGGTVLSLAVAPGATPAVYAATASGVDESADGGSSWRHLDGGLGGRYVAVLAVDPSDARILYAGTGGSGLWKSEDGGATWRPRPIAPGVADIRALTVDARNPQTVFAAATATFPPSVGGLFKSTDRGDTWHDVAGSSPWRGSVSSIAVDPASSSIVYAAAFGVLRSSDGGETWTALPGAPNFALQVVLDPRRPGTILVGSTSGLEISAGNAFARSTDGGATWASITPPGSTAIIGLPLALAADGTLYTAGFRSADDGATWTPTAPLAARTTAIATAPDAPGTLYAASVDRGVFRSGDGARSWQGASRGLRAAGIGAVAAVAAGRAAADLYVEVPLVGLLREHRSTAAAWVPLLAFDRPSFIAAAPGRPSTLYTSSFDDDTGSRLLRSADGGATWRSLPVPESCAILAPVTIDPRSPATLYLGGTGSTNICDSEQRFGFKSVDAGKTWTPLAGLHDPIAYAIDPRRPASLYAIDSWNGILSSRDGGASWSPATQGFSGTPVRLAVDPTNFAVLYVAADSGLFVSTDRARHWRLVSTFVADASALLVDPRSPATLYAGIVGRGVFRSLDRGRTWTSLNVAGAAAQFSGALTLDPVQAGVLYAGTASGLFRIDAGTP